MVYTESHEPSPTVENIEEGRKNQKAWIYVVEIAIPAIYGVSKFEVNVRSRKIREFISISDEAFARLVLIAYHDQLKELCKRFKDGEDDMDELPVGMYTNKRVSRCARHSGWSLDGINKYGGG